MSVFPAAHVLMREGEPGGHFYAIADREVEITVHGRPVGVRRRCDGLGEIALLRNTPRTATATTLTETLLYRLDKEPFLVAVTGHAGATTAAEQVVRERLATAAASD